MRRHLYLRARYCADAQPRNRPVSFRGIVPIERLIALGAGRAPLRPSNAAGLFGETGHYYLGLTAQFRSSGVMSNQFKNCLTFFGEIMRKM